MTDAFIYDHVRTPRGRGRPDGALHEVSAIRLASRVLEALAERSRLDTALIDDVILVARNRWESRAAISGAPPC